MSSRFMEWIAAEGHTAQAPGKRPAHAFLSKSSRLHHRIGSQVRLHGQAPRSAIRADDVVMLSRLYPNSHIVPHWGDTNVRLKIHLGIKVPEGTLMRVGERLVWKEGRCVVFDDSFEHEGGNLSAEHKIILLFDIAHPALSGRNKPENQPVKLADSIRTFLNSRCIAETNCGT